MEVFDTLWEAKVLAERWHREYNQRRPHSALAYRPPVPKANSPGRRHWILSLGVDFKWSQVTVQFAFPIPIHPVGAILYAAWRAVSWLSFRVGLAGPREGVQLRHTLD